MLFRAAMAGSIGIFVIQLCAFIVSVYTFHEIATFGPEPEIDRDLVNVALGQRAYQSDTNNSQTADKAVDGRVDAVQGTSSEMCTLTTKTSNAFWEVDLGQMYSIDHVIVYNMQFCCEEDLRGLRLLIGNTSSHYKLHGYHKSFVWESHTFQLKEAAVGRWVQITRDSSVNVPLAICEVEVFGKPYHKEWTNTPIYSPGKFLYSACKGAYCKQLDVTKVRREKMSLWPPGPYAILTSNDDACPETEYHGWKKGIFEIKAPSNGTDLTLNVCVKIRRSLDFPADPYDWMSGSYSIYMSGSTCPEGFTEFNRTVAYETYSYAGDVSSFSVVNDSGRKYILFYLCGRNTESEIGESYTEFLRQQFMASEDCKLALKTGVATHFASCFTMQDDEFKLISDYFISSWTSSARDLGDVQFVWYQFDLRRTLLVSEIKFVSGVFKSKKLFKLGYITCFYDNVKRTVSDAILCNEKIIFNDYRLQMRKVKARYITLKFNGSFVSEKLLSKESISFLISNLLEKDMCNEDLGIEDGTIQDFQIKASSWLPQYLPSAARPFSVGWCADVIDRNPWILFDLVVSTRVEGVSLWTYGQNDENEFENTTQHISFYLFHGLNTNALIQYNYTDFSTRKQWTTEVQTFMFINSFEARYVKLEIRNSGDNNTCLRFELHGCKLSGIPTLDCPNRYNMFALDREIRTESNPVIHKNTNSHENCSSLCRLDDNCSIVSYRNEEHCIEYPVSKVGMWQIDDLLTGKWSAKLCDKDSVELFPTLIPSSNHWFASGTITNVENIKQNSIITSIGYPFSYGNGQNYKWIIRYPNNRFIRIVFTDMSLGQVNEECLDRLIASSTIDTKMEKTEIDRQHNGKVFVIETSEYVLFLTFFSCIGQREVGSRGFRAIVTGQDVPACFPLTDQRRSGSDLFCKRPQMIITSLSILNIPSLNIEEVWKIDVTEVEHHTLKIYLTDFYVRCWREDTRSMFAVREIGEEMSFCNTDIPLNTIDFKTFSVIVKFRRYYDNETVQLRTEGFRILYLLVDRSLKRLIDYSHDTGDEYKVCSETFKKCYHIKIGLKTWDEASELCRKCSQMLVSVHSQYEMQFVNYLLRYRKITTKLSSEDNHLKEHVFTSHIGSRRVNTRKAKNVYVWENASPVTYFPWKSDNPVDGKDCTRTSFHFITNRTWESQDCISDLSLFFICQSPIEDSNYGGMGKACDEEESFKADIVVMIRRAVHRYSEYIFYHGANFGVMLDFVAKLVASFEIGPHAIRVAAIPFAEWYLTEISFGFNDANTTEDAVKKIRGISRTKLGSETHAFFALRYMNEDLSWERLGVRYDNVPRICILLTDKESDYPKLTIEEASKAKNAGIKILVIGIGNVDDEELTEVVSAPRFENYIHVEHHHLLNEVLRLEMYRKISVIATKNKCKDVIWTDWKLTENINLTFSGTPCQTWATLTTQAGRDFAIRFPHVDKPSQAHNYCQDPASSGILWCYTAGSWDQLWEPCFMQLSDLESRYRIAQRNTSEAKCDDGSDVHSFDICDGVFDCDDLSDEMSCSKSKHYLTRSFDNSSNENNPERLTRGLYFHCGSKEWISLLAKCDDVIDCADASDELDCVLPMSEFNENVLSCYDDGCKECDFSPSHTTAEAEIREFRECESGEHKCENKQCISIKKRCNGVLDCIDGTDEDQCDSCKDSLHCDMVKCVPFRLKCDKYKDCDDGTDETSCVNETFSSCDEWWEHGYHTSGQYMLDGISVYCDFKVIRKTGKIMFIINVDAAIDNYKGVIYARSPSDNFVEFKSPAFRDLIYRDGYSCFLEVQRTCQFPTTVSVVGDSSDNDMFPNCECITETFKAVKLDQYLYLESTNKYSFVRNKSFSCNGTDISGDLVKGNWHFNVTDDGFFYVDGGILKGEVPIQITPKRFTCTYDYRIPPSLLCMYEENSDGIVAGYRSGYLHSHMHLQNCGNFSCPSNTVKCPQSYCIPLRFICDDYVHCPGGEDEHECIYENIRRQHGRIILQQACANTARKVLVFVKVGSDSEESKTAAVKLATQFYTTRSDIRLLYYQTDNPLEEFEIKHRLLEIREEQIYISQRVNPTGECRYKSMARNLLGSIQFASNDTTGIVFIEDSFESTQIAELLFSNLSKPEFMIYRVFKDSEFTLRDKISNVYRFVQDVPIPRWNVLFSTGYKRFPEICQGATEVPCSGGYRCLSSKKCIPLEHVCDGNAQCQFKDDERLCDFLCPHNCTCIGYTVNCRAANLTFNDTKSLSLNIRIADMSQNQELKDVLTISMFRFSSLTKLNMSSCEIESLSETGFLYLSNLKCLDIGYNRIALLPDSLFRNLDNLVFLNLDGNFELQLISSTAFLGLKSLKHLRITGTKLKKISSFTFSDLTLQSINISYNEIREIEDYAFNGTSVQKIDFRGNEISIFNKRIFDGVLSLQELKTSAFKFCCIRPCTVDESNCFPQKNEFSSCADLMRHPVLQAVLWIVGTTAIFGNIGSILYRFLYDKKRLKIGYGIFVTNLAGADLLMGIYLIMIAVVDALYRDRYIYVDDKWRHSNWCVTAGILSTVSSEASVMFVCLITLDRLLVIKYPFGTKRLDQKKAYLCCIVSWAVAVLIAIIPVVFTGYFEGEFYSRSAVCIALPLTRDKPPGWMYSVSIFVGLNFCTFFLVAFGQLSIFSEVRKSAVGIMKTQNARKRDLQVARHLLVVASSDFLCWFPIGLMGLMALNGYPITGDVYAWTAVFILPLNSALNPILYTLSVIIGNQSSKPNKEEQNKLEIQQETGSAILMYQNFIRSIRSRTDLARLGQNVRDLLQQDEPIHTVTVLAIGFHLSKCLSLLHESSIAINKLSTNTTYVKMSKTKKHRVNIILDSKIFISNDEKVLTDNINHFGIILRGLLAKVTKDENNRA